MTLFGDRAESDLRRAVTLVEETIRALGLDPADCRVGGTGGPARYSLRRGSASILVALSEPTAVQEDGSIRVVAPVVRVPPEAEQGPFFKHLLELNAESLAGLAFGVLGKDVVLVAERSLRDLDASEVDAMIRAVGRDADRFDDHLATLFKTTRASD
jgi:hypothetical protein